MHRLRYALSDAIDCPEFHLPVFWIPAFPAGMTVLAGSFQSQRLVIPAGIAGTQSPWRAMYRLPYAFSDAIDCPQFHLPVFWIPAIPAGMTVLAGSFQSQRLVIPAGIAGI